MYKPVSLLLLLILNFTANAQVKIYDLPQPTLNYSASKTLTITAFIPQNVAVKGGVANCYLYTDTNMLPIYYDKNYTFPANAPEQTTTFAITNVSAGIYFLRYAILAKDSTHYLSVAAQVELNSTTSIDEFQSSVIKAYPNPANDFIFIPVLQEIGDSSAEFFDITGAKQEVIITNGIANVASLTKGIYFITIQYNGHKKSLKFLKE